MSWLFTLNNGKMASRPDMGPILNAAIGTPAIHREKAYWMADIPVNGTYHGLTVIKLNQWAANDSDMSGFAMVFQEPIGTVKQKLSKLKFSADDTGAKAMLTTTATKPPRASLICDSQ